MITRTYYLVELREKGFYAGHDSLWEPIYSGIEDAKRYKTRKGAEDRGEHELPFMSQKEHKKSKKRRQAYRIHVLQEIITQASSVEEWHEAQTIEEVQQEYAEEKNRQRAAGEIKNITLGDLIVKPHAVPGWPV